MMYTRALFLILTVPVLLVAASGNDQSPPEAEKVNMGPQWQDFSILTERNIFVRNRTIPGPKREAPTMIPVIIPRDLDADMVLTGTAMQGEVATAFVENARTGEVLTVHRGDAVGSGRITAITLDGIDYSRKELSRTVEVGQSLVGSSASTGTRPTETAGSGSPSTKKTPEDDLSTILERMRQRRQQEMKK